MGAVLHATGTPTTLERIHRPIYAQYEQPTANIGGTIDPQFGGTLADNLRKHSDPIMARLFDSGKEPALLSIERQTKALFASYLLSESSPVVITLWEEFHNDLASVFIDNLTDWGQVLQRIISAPEKLIDPGELDWFSRYLGNQDRAMLLDRFARLRWRKPRGLDQIDPISIELIGDKTETDYAFQDVKNIVLPVPLHSVDWPPTALNVSALLDDIFSSLLLKYVDLDLKEFCQTLSGLRIRGLPTEDLDREYLFWHTGTVRDNITLDPWHATLHRLLKKSYETIPKLVPSDLEFCALAIEELKYLGPARAQGSRFATFDGRRELDVGTAGQNASNLIARDSQLREVVNQWLNRFDIPYQYEPVFIETGRGNSLLDARLVDRRNGTVVSVSDVGYGVSQVVPVIVQALLLQPLNAEPEVGEAGRGRTLIVEQPELHLHPAMQAELGELFADVITKSPDTQIIAETHSEALILRIMKLIRTGRLDSESVNVLWVDQDETGTSFVRKLPIDPSGEFEVSWPRGFFSERYAEMDD